MPLFLRTLKALCLILIASTFSCKEKPEDQASKKPNIIYIMSDDHTSQAFGIYGSRLATLNPTPTLDKIAKEGVIQISGPFGDDETVRGISIYRCPDLEAAKQLAHGDPAVKAGRLKVRVRPWWAAVGSELRQD